VDRRGLQSQQPGIEMRRLQARCRSESLQRATTQESAMQRPPEVPPFERTPVSPLARCSPGDQIAGHISSLRPPSKNVTAVTTSV
jgi:hypothetical protein